MQTTRGFLSSSPPELWFGIGDTETVDSIEVFWNHYQRSVVKQIPADQYISVSYSVNTPYIPETPASTISLDLADVGIDFEHRETPFNDYADQVLLPYKLSQNGPYASTGDLNGDGLDDVYVGGAAGQSGALFTQQPDGSFSESDLSNQSQYNHYEEMQSVIADIDTDGRNDILIASGSNEFPAGDIRNGYRIHYGNGTQVTSEDIDNMPMIEFTQLTDQGIFLGGRGVGGQYLQPADSYILNDSYFEKLGMATDGIGADMDGDGDQDLLVVGEWMNPTALINNNGRYTQKPILDELVGIWWTVETADINNDGLPDFVLGNLGWNNKFGGAKPKLHAQAGDLDGNGDYDVVLSTTKNGKSYPVRGRECSSQEMPGVLAAFPTYDDFASAELSDILDKVTAADSELHSINTFQ